eukprot:4132556-Prymnesium_polylepis.2
MASPWRTCADEDYASVQSWPRARPCARTGASSLLGCARHSHFVWLTPNVRYGWAPPTELSSCGLKRHSITRTQNTHGAKQAAAALRAAAAHAAADS